MKTLRGRDSAQAPAAPRRVAERTVVEAGVTRQEDWAVFLVTAVPLALLALYAALHLGIFSVDALARSYSAMEAVRGYEPKLANLDLAWPPLPGLLLLPIAWLLPNVTSTGGGAPLLSAIAAGVCAILLNRIMAPRVPGKPLRYLLLACVLANPMTLGLAISGLTEMIALAFILLIFSGLDRLATGSQPIFPLVTMGAAAGALLVSRFESALLAVMVGLTLAVFFWRKRDAGGKHYVVAMVLGYAVPVIYTAGVLLFLCATITGNPIYFLTGPGSNDVYTEVIVNSTPMLAKLVHDPIETLIYLGRATISFSPLILAALPLAIVVAVRRRDFALAALIVMTLWLPLAQFGLLITGRSAGWTRYLYTNAIFALLLLVWCATAMERSRAIARYAMPLIVLALLANNGVAWARMDDLGVRSDLRSSTGGAEFLEAVLGVDSADNYDPQIEAEESIAAMLREHLFAEDPDALVLIDSSQATRIILFSQRENRFISQNVIDFENILARPEGTVTYLLVPDTLPERNVILTAYPGLFEGVYPNLTLVSEFNGVFVDAGNTFYRWGLFRVGDGSSAAAQ